MFWIFWLPIIVFVAMMIWSVIDIVVGFGDWDDFAQYIFISFLTAAIVFMIFGLGSVLISYAVPAKSVYSDTENPVYLVQFPGSENNQYLISTEDLKSGEKYSYYFINPETGIPEQEFIDRSKARLVFDNPEKPFYAEVKYTCPASEFWLVDCASTSPYKIEFHLPDNSILK
jgi:hypothetical protein